MATFRVTSLSVSTDKNTYTPYEKVKLHIICTVQRNKEGFFDLHPNFQWNTYYGIYNVATGVKLYSQGNPHSVLPTTQLDTANEDFTMNLGPFAEIGTYQLEVVVKARDA